MTSYLPSTLSAAATPANRSALPETAAGTKTRVTSGRRCIASYESSGRDGSFARTLLDTLNSASTPYSLTWTLRATPQRRSLFQLVPSGRLTGGTEYGLLPTPLASDCRGRWGRIADNLLRHYLPRRFGGSYPSPSLLEAMMGFPTAWSEPRPSATQSSRRFPNSSEGRSSLTSTPAQTA